MWGFGPFQLRHCWHLHRCSTTTSVKEKITKITENLSYSITDKAGTGHHMTRDDRLRRKLICGGDQQTGVGIPVPWMFSHHHSTMDGKTKNKPNTGSPSVAYYTRVGWLTDISTAAARLAPTRRPMVRIRQRCYTLLENSNFSQTTRITTSTEKPYCNCYTVRSRCAVYDRKFCTHNRCPKPINTSLDKWFYPEWYLPSIGRFVHWLFVCYYPIVVGGLLFKSCLRAKLSGLDPNRGHSQVCVTNNLRAIRAHFA